jgi:hypothetical protein
VDLFYGHAILLPRWGEQPGGDHRLLCVTFKALDGEEDEVPVPFTALVDLTDRRVLLAGPEPSLDRPSKPQKGRGQEEPSDDRGVGSAPPKPARSRSRTGRSSTHEDEGEEDA